MGDSGEPQLHLRFEGASLRKEKDVDGIELQLRMGVGRSLPPAGSSFSPGQAGLYFPSPDPRGLFAAIVRSLTPDLRALLRHAAILRGTDPAGAEVLWMDGGPAFRKL